MTNKSKSSGIFAFYAAYPAFTLSFLFLTVASLILLVSVPQNEQFLTVNRLHHPVADAAFQYITYGGDGLMMVLLAAVLLFVRFKYAVYTIACFVSTGLIAQGIKRSLKLPRPAKVFDGLHDIHIPQDYAVHFNNSFPSGHTTTAFAMMEYCITSFPTSGIRRFCFSWRCLWGIHGFICPNIFRRMFVPER